MKEPSVSIQMIVENYDSAAISGQNIAGGVVVSNCGPLEPTLCYSSTEVLNQFTTGGKITRNIDTSVIHASAIADIMPVFIKRAYNDDGARAAVAIYRNSQLYYKDARFYPNEYILPYSTDSNYNTILEKIKEVLPELGVKNPDYEGEIPAELTDEFYDELSEMYLTDDDGQFVFNYDKIELTSYYEFIRKDNLNLTTRKSLKLNYSEGTTSTDGIIKRNQSFYIIINDICYYKGPQPTDIEYEFHTSEEEEQKDPIPFEGRYVELDTLSAKCTIKDFIHAVNINSNNTNCYIAYNGLNSYTLYTSLEDLTDEQDRNILYGNIEFYDDSLPETISASSDVLCYLVAVNPAELSYTAEVKMDPQDSDLIEILVNTNSRNYDYSGSCDPEYTNTYGGNQYIENINDYNGIPFNIIIPEAVQEAATNDWDSIMEILSWSNKNLVTLIDGTSYYELESTTGPNADLKGIQFGYMTVNTDSADNEANKAALKILCDQDDVKIAFLCPFGNQNSNYLATLASYGPKIWCFTPIGLFADKDDAEYIKALKPTTVNTEYAICMAPYDKNSGLADYVIPLSLEVAYLQGIMNNAAKYCEFAPFMGKENGVLSITKPSVQLSRTTRESLLDSKIMSVITRTTESINYLNKNQCTGSDNILNEDQNIRLACKINRDLDTLLEPMIGRFNTEETRSRVVTSINNYFANNITNQVYSIDSFEVICDETNNPADIRASNQLVVDLTVRYLNAIYDVNIYHRALNVAQ